MLKLVNNVRHLFAADDFSRSHFSDAFFLCALRVKCQTGVGADLSPNSYQQMAKVTARLVSRKEFNQQAIAYFSLYLAKHPFCETYTNSADPDQMLQNTTIISGSPLFAYRMFY